MKAEEIKIDSISIKRVTEKIEDSDEIGLEVYNIELESNSEEDDLFYTDVDSGLVHHNCLRKDFGMINEHFPQTDLLLQAYKINEYLPKLCADKGALVTKGATVGILGYTFKANTDDTRDTLTYKLISYIKRNNPKKLMVSDHNLPEGEYIDSMNNDFTFDNADLEDIITNCDVIYIATNHSMYDEITLDELEGKVIIDPWRVLGKDMVIDLRGKEESEETIVIDGKEIVQI